MCVAPLASMSQTKIVALVIGGCVALVGAVFAVMIWAVTRPQVPAAQVTFDNTTDSALNIEIDGRVAVKLAPRGTDGAAAKLRLAAHATEVVARDGAGQEVERRTVSLQEAQYVYPLGSFRRYAVSTLDYASSKRSAKLLPVSKQGVLSVVPMHALDDGLDAPFPKRITLYGTGRDAAVRRHLCRVYDRAEVGCNGGAARITSSDTYTGLAIDE